MGRACLIKGCPSVKYESGEKLIFYRLKRHDPSIYNYWIQVISIHNGQDVSNHLKSAAICSKHFTYDSFVKGFNNHLNSYALPTIFPETENDNLIKSQIDNIPKPPTSMEYIKNRPLEDTSLELAAKRRRIFFPGDIHNDDLQTASPSTLINCIRILKTNHIKTKLKIKRMAAQNKRQQETIDKLKLMNKSLKQKVLASEEQEEEEFMITTDDHSYSKRVQLETNEIILKSNEIMNAAIRELDNLPKNMKKVANISIFTRQLKQLINDNKRAIT